MAEEKTVAQILMENGQKTKQELKKRTESAQPSEVEMTLAEIQIKMNNLANSEDPKDRLEYFNFKTQRNDLLKKINNIE